MKLIINEKKQRIKFHVNSVCFEKKLDIKE
jgi:hypothetical protein